MAYFKLDTRYKPKKKALPKKKTTTKKVAYSSTYFKVIGYDKFTRKYSVAIYINRVFYGVRLMSKEEISSFKVKVISNKTFQK